MRRFNDKIVLVTGGNSGIGLDAAMAFAREGARVVITGRNQQTLDRAVEAIGKGTLGIKADSAQVSEIERVMDAVRQRHGRLDTLFVNAGVCAFSDIDAVSEDEWDWIQDVNLKGAFFTIQKALALLVDGGSIVINSSAAHIKGFGRNNVYAASKGGLRSITRTAALALAPRNIRVNMVSPGAIDTPILDRTAGAPPADEAMEMFASLSPLGRVGEPREVSAPVLFLASDDASYITGQDLVICGGATC